MKFHETDAEMRENETSRDGSIPASAYIIARLDGRGFSRLTNSRFEKPFDLRFHQLMLETVRFVMQNGINIPFAYTQSDEISLLIPPYHAEYGRKARKLLSLLAAAASARFSLLLGEVATFDCRLNLQYDFSKVSEYFRWRQIDAERNAFNAYCFWLLRRDGMDAQTATDYLRRMSVPERRDMLEAKGTDFAALPCWQTGGVCLYWTEEERTGFNPMTGEPTVYTRRMLRVDENLQTALAALM
ncbi:MAG: hypothetical protein IKW19_05740 [Akkermansia sp.]|nr:hypothetical protein [Akkermansia sp.]